MTRDEVEQLLRRGGFVAAAEEAGLLTAAAGGDAALLAELLARRLTGEPLAWIIGWAELAGVRVVVHPGVYVPRAHSAAMARRAAELLPAGGVAVDVCTGCGAIAAVLRARREGITLVATDIDPVAVANAQANGVAALHGPLLAPVPADLVGQVDVVVGVVPYVPTAAIGLLHRDAVAFEPRPAYDGGIDGCTWLRETIADAPRVLRAGGALLLELGGDEADLLAPDLGRAGFTDVHVHADDEGDARWIEARLTRRSSRRSTA